MPVGTIAKDVVEGATLGDMEIAATVVVVDTAAVGITIEDMVVVVGLGGDTDLVMDMDMDIETVATLGTIQATEIQVTDMGAKRVGAIIVAATEVVTIVMIAVIVDAIITHGQDTNLETKSIAANANDCSIYHRIRQVNREAFIAILSCSSAELQMIVSTQSHTTIQVPLPIFRPHRQVLA